MDINIDLIDKISGLIESLTLLEFRKRNFRPIFTNVRIKRCDNESIDLFFLITSIMTNF